MVVVDRYTQHLAKPAGALFVADFPVDFESIDGRKAQESYCGGSQIIP